MERLLDMLQYKRPHESKSERRFIRRFIDPYMYHANVTTWREDWYGNRIATVGDPKARTIFSCHTDTVHRHKGRQRLIHDTHQEVVYKDDGEPLGADDGAGVWLLLEMIDSGVDGTYIFHRAEEIGGLGSEWITGSDAQWITGNYDRCIAFDRKGTKDIITEQMTGVCCSDNFAWALGRQLKLGHVPSNMGSFTDTANYVELVSECSNVSVGYDFEHTENECLDLSYLGALRDAVMRVNWEDLPTEHVYDPNSGFSGWGNTYQFGGTKSMESPHYDSSNYDPGFLADDPWFRNESEALQYLMDNPKSAAKLLLRKFG